MAHPVCPDLLADVRAAIREAEAVMTSLPGMGWDVIASRPTVRDVELARELGRHEGIVLGLRRAEGLLCEQRPIPPTRERSKE